MKKLLKMMLSLGMCFSLVACSSSNANEDVVQVFIDSCLKLDELNSVHYEIAVDGTFDDQSLGMNVHGDLLNAKENLQLSLLLDLSYYGFKLNDIAELYKTEDTAYLSFMGANQKIALADFDFDIDATLDDPAKHGFTVEGVKPYLKSATKNGDTIQLVIDMKKVKDKLDNDALNSYSVEDPVLAIEMSDGFLSKITTTINATETSSDTTGSLNVVMSLTDINQKEAIDFPDFSDYQDNSALSD